MSDAPLRLLLGPQRPEHNLDAAFAAAGLPDGPVATISAGMQEAEGDLAHVEQAVARPLLDLRLYQRTEQCLEADAGLRGAYRDRQERLMELQRLYRRRLQPLVHAVRDIHSVPGEHAMLAPERRHAMAQLRALDHHHLTRVERIHAEFEAGFGATIHPLLADHARDISDRLAACACVLITGGNVIVLANRLRLFGLGTLLESRPVVAWSAGAMVLASRIVLYHDRMPLARRAPEVLGAGLGLLPGWIFLPDAQHRLRTDDALRTALFGRRFAPDACLALDNGAALTFAGTELRANVLARRITRTGRLAKVRAA